MLPVSSFSRSTQWAHLNLARCAMSFSSTAFGRPFGRAGEKGLYAETRADDMVVAVIRELLRRHPISATGAHR